jgi:type IV pilus assembly protein PilN
MRLDINLASQPYEDSRQFWLRWGAAVCAAGIVTLVLLTLDATGWVNARRDRAAIAQKQAMIADRDQLRADAEKILNRPENRATRDESQFLNQLIERKAFSWTRVLENLEKVMPPRVHLVAISPQLNEDNELALKMTVAGDSRERAIELARRMEESRRFAQTQMVTEHFSQSATGDTEQFEIAAIYIPEPLALTAAPATPGQATSAQKTDALSKTGLKPKTETAKPLTAKPNIPPNSPSNTPPNTQKMGGTTPIIPAPDTNPKVQAPKRNRH